MAVPIAVRSHGANLYAVAGGQGMLLVDAGWPRSLPDLKAGLEEAGLRLSAIRFVMTTHAHPDHAGLLQTLKRRSGVRRIVHQGSISEGDQFLQSKLRTPLKFLVCQDTSSTASSSTRIVPRTPPAYV